MSNDMTPRTEDTRPVKHWRVPAIELIEHEDAHQLLVEIPGTTIENVDVQIDGRVLTLVAHRTDKETFGYERSLRLPKRIATDSVTAQLHHGLLNLQLPHIPPTQPTKVPITT